MTSRSLKALLFDFDGVVVDSEGPGYEAWKEIYSEYKCELPLHEWVKCIGSIGGFDPFSRLEQLSGAQIDRQKMATRRLARKTELMESEQVRPGVLELLDSARQLGAEAYIVSSSSRKWVDDQLTRLGIADRWKAIVSADGNAAQAKPSPYLYLHALEIARVDPDEAIAIEDSPNGISAAKAAGIFCVAVANEMTKGLDLTEADIRLESLADLDLTNISQVDASSKPPAPGADPRATASGFEEPS